MPARRWPLSLLPAFTTPEGGPEDWRGAAIDLSAVLAKLYEPRPGIRNVW